MPSYPQYLEAATAARRVAGVKNVHNHLEVVLPAGDVVVDTCGNTVTLTGHVATWAEHDAVIGAGSPLTSGMRLFLVCAACRSKAGGSRPGSFSCRAVAARV